MCYVCKKTSGAYSCTFMTVVLVAHHPPLCHIRMDKKWYRNALERSILSFFIYLPIYVYSHSLIDSSGPSLDQSIHLICVYLSIYPSIWLSIYLSILSYLILSYLSIYLTYLSYLSIYLFIYLILCGYTNIYHQFIYSHLRYNINSSAIKYQRAILRLWRAKIERFAPDCQESPSEEISLETHLLAPLENAGSAEHPVSKKIRVFYPQRLQGGRHFAVYSKPSYHEGHTIAGSPTQKKLLIVLKQGTVPGLGILHLDTLKSPGLWLMDILSQVVDPTMVHLRLRGFLPSTV